MAKNEALGGQAAVASGMGGKERAMCSPIIPARCLLEQKCPCISFLAK